MRAHQRFAVAMAVAAVLGVTSVAAVVVGTWSADRAGTSTTSGAGIDDPPTTTSDPKPGE
ncbi:hypothetical protein ABZ816_03110 [Actinosynnema sp. NPDC047251]|uniref:hypothetical protein n=1 Tax=Saccharothrix espanaensis TaxID=103731 RepID=UPI0002EC93CA|nr:hypothetical protein [Saccharothrix espanaensis]